MGSTRSSSAHVSTRGEAESPALARPRLTCQLGELTERITVVNGVALVRQGRQVHAFADTCPHGAASLADGVVRGGVVTCPRHGARFRLRDGRAVAGPTRTPLALLTAVVHEGVVRVLEGAPTRPPLLTRIREAVKEALDGQPKHVH
jgi:3-phenylpropionate/trans-cinnamate dioxygenase ferredoxin subunit